MPATGPVVLASTHVSFLDFLLVGLAAPEQPAATCGSWPVTTSGATRWPRPLMTRDAARARWTARRRRRRTCGPGSLLREGEAVGIFPEAGVSTSYTVRALMPGAVALARETGAPLLPMAIWGPQRILTARAAGGPAPRAGRSRCSSARPLYVGPGDRPARGTARLGDTLQRMLDDLQRRPGAPAARPGSTRPGTRRTSAVSAPRPAGAAASRCRGERCRRRELPGRSSADGWVAVRERQPARVGPVVPVRRRGCRRSASRSGRRAG